jgi:hypothetical protein
MDTKVCTGCGGEFPATVEFFHRKKNGKFGLRSVCKSCALEYQREYCKTNGDKCNKYQSEYRNDNKDKIKEYQSEYRKKKKVVNSNG